MNPIINQMMNSIVGNNPFVKMFQSLRSAQNPNAMMQSAAQSNPQIGQVMNYINQNGGNAKELYYNMCKQKGVDPNIIINQLKNS